jgi:hypothetical protein
MSIRPVDAVAISWLSYVIVAAFVFTKASERWRWHSPVATRVFRASGWIAIGFGVVWAFDLVHTYWGPGNPSTPPLNSEVGLASLAACVFFLGYGVRALTWRPARNDHQAGGGKPLPPA